MNLCSVSEEVIHMTSRAIRGLVPNLSGDNRCISSSHLHPFFPSSLPHGKPLIRNMAIQVCGHEQGHSPTVRICMLSVCMFFLFFSLFLPASVHTSKTKGDKEPSLVPEESSIRTGSDPGGQMQSRGARTHPGWIQGSSAVAQGARGVVRLIRHTVRLTGMGLMGARGSVRQFWIDISLNDCLCTSWPF